MNVDPLEQYRKELREQFYTVLPADRIISAAERRQIAETVFAEGQLERDHEEIAKKRDRADDILVYTWPKDGTLQIEEAPPNHRDPCRISIDYTAVHEEQRHYKRFCALYQPALPVLIERLMHLVPRERRQPEGTFDVHAFRTFGQVVYGPHRDGNEETPVDWVISYIVSKQGTGACTRLSEDKPGEHLVHQVELAEGQLAMHRDEKFFHDVTKLESATEKAQRDALIMTIRPKFDVLQSRRSP